MIDPQNNSARIVTPTAEQSSEPATGGRNRGRGRDIGKERPKTFRGGYQHVNALMKATPPHSRSNIRRD